MKLWSLASASHPREHGHHVRCVLTYNSRLRALLGAGHAHAASGRASSVRSTPIS